MFENTKESINTLKMLAATGETSSGKEIEILTAIMKGEFELERSEILIDTLVKGMKEIYLSKTTSEAADKIVDLIDWYNNHTKEDEPKIIKENDSRSSHEKRLESI